MGITIREFLKKHTYTRDQIERFLNPHEPNWATFDAELGYRLRAHNVIKDGVDGCRTILNVLPSGERRMTNFADQPCRINTYGDSFTQCCQTSDDETWQEISTKGIFTEFLDTGKTYFEILWSSSKDGNAYIILAKQYIGTKLNRLFNDDNLPQSIEDEMTIAKSILENPAYMYIINIKFIKDPICPFLKFCFCFKIHCLRSIY